jgi:glycosyltransferase involved in cell wall biosynthesis
MDVSVIIPAQGSEAAELAATLRGVFDQRYDGGRIEVFVARYGDGASIALPPLGQSVRVRHVAVENPSPYVARNLAAREATGEIMLFTEPGCVPDPAWVSAHVSAIRDRAITLSIGHVAGVRETWALRTFRSYEDVRDEWVFSGQSWRHLFGRPKNMAIARHRFVSHGPFAEVIRGADSKLVQHVAREVSTSEIGHTPGAVVRQQAVRGLPSCLRDRFSHARALRIHRSGHAAPIDLEVRVRIYRTTVARRGYGPVASVALLGFLAAGIAAYRLGGASARFVRQPPIATTAP